MYPSKQTKICTKKKHPITGCFFRLIIFPVAAKLERCNFNVPGKEFFPVGCCFAVRSTLKNTTEVIFRAQVMNFCGFDHRQNPAAAFGSFSASVEHWVFPEQSEWTDGSLCFIRTWGKIWIVQILCKVFPAVQTVIYCLFCFWGFNYFPVLLFQKPFMKIVKQRLYFLLMSFKELSFGDFSFIKKFPKLCFPVENLPIQIHSFLCGLRLCRLCRFSSWTPWMHVAVAQLDFVIRMVLVPPGNCRVISWISVWLDYIAFKVFKEWKHVPSASSPSEIVSANLVLAAENHLTELRSLLTGNYIRLWQQKLKEILLSDFFFLQKRLSEPCA